LSVTYSGSHEYGLVTACNHQSHSTATIYTAVVTKPSCITIIMHKYMKMCVQ